MQLADKDEEIARLQQDDDVQLIKAQMQESTTRIQEMRQDKDQLSAKLASVQDALSSQQETNRQLVEDLRDLTESLAEQKRERKREMAMQDHQSEGNQLALTQELTRLQEEVLRQANYIQQLESQKPSGMVGMDIHDLQVIDSILAKRRDVLEKIADLKRQVSATVQ
jgi:hypothetical protein